MPKKLFLQSLYLIVLAIFFFLPSSTKSAAAIHPPHSALPSSPHTTEPGPVLDQTYAVKHLLYSIMDTFPDLTIQEALSRSALLGIISETDVQLHMYGTSTLQPDPRRPGRTLRVFDTATTLNKIARSMLDVLDDKIRSTVQESNPFCTLEGKALAHIMKALTSGGVENLITLLKNEAFTSPWAKEWETKVNRPSSGSDEKKKYSLSEFKAKIKDFIKLLVALDKEAKTSSEKTKNMHDLTKLFMTFLSTKDQKQRATGKSTLIEDYYTTLLGKPFKATYYTPKELGNIGKTLLGHDSHHAISKNTKGLEDVTSYLVHCLTGNVSFLSMPYGAYNSATRDFNYCVEATIRSIMNSILYNPKTKMLDIGILPPALREKINPRFLQFIQKHPNPATADYYGNSLEEWLDLINDIPGVIYKQEDSKGPYEISGATGPKNLITSLNYIFGTDANSLETFGKALSHQAAREVSFVPQTEGFAFAVTLEGQVDPLVAAVIVSTNGLSHASFTIKRNSVVPLLHHETFRSSICEFSDYAHVDLYGSIFMNKPGEFGPTPLQTAIRNRWVTLVKTMVTYGTDPNFKGSSLHSPLDEAIQLGEPEIINALLQAGAHITGETLATACAVGNLNLAKRFISGLEERGESIDFPSLLSKIAESPAPSLPLFEFLISKGSIHLAERDALGTTLLLTAIKNGSFSLVKYLDTQGVLEPSDTFALRTALLEALQQAASHATKDVSIVKYLLARGATLPSKEQTKKFIDLLVLHDNASLVQTLMEAHVLSDPLPFDKTTSLVSLVVKQGKFAIAQILIEQTSKLPPSLLLDVISSDRFTTEQKLQLTKAIVEKEPNVSAKVLEEAHENLAAYEGFEGEELGEEDKTTMLRETQQWTALINLLEQAQAEESFGLPLTLQEQKCITECVA